MGYKVHHLNCGTFCMHGGRLMTGKGSLLRKAEMCCHCLLIETDQGLVLVDTGFAHKDITSPTFPQTQLLKHAMGAKFLPEECAAIQIKALGLSPHDVTHIILTHLDPDHAGGLMDFPNAQVHVQARELEAALNPVTLWEKTRYRQYLWRHKPNWRTYSPEGEKWHGFDAVRALSGDLYDILLVPLQGHTRGHCGVAVSTENGWLLHCGDAYFHSAEVSADSAAKTPVGLFLLQTFDDVSRAERIYNQNRLRQLKRQHGDDITLIASHDYGAFDLCKDMTRPLAKQPLLQPN